MGENSIDKTAIGKVTSFNPITKDGLIVVKKTKENVVIQDRANKKDPLIFTLLENVLGGPGDRPGPLGGIYCTKTKPSGRGINLMGSRRSIVMRKRQKIKSKKIKT